MKDLILPISPLSRRIIMHQYPEEPIRLNPRDLLFKQLRYRADGGNYLERQQYALTSTITLRLNSRMYDEVLANAMTAGYHLYELHKDRMFYFVWSQTKLGEKALYALKSFYLEHRIDEDDFSLDTAYRIWKRWKERRKDVLHNTHYTVPKNAINPSLPVLTVGQAETLYQRLQNMIQVGTVEFDGRTLRALRSYILYRYTRMRQIDVAENLDRHRQAIGDSAKRVQLYLEQNPDLNELIEYLVQTTEPEPTPM